MENNIIDSIIENLFYVLPAIHKKLLKVDLTSIYGDINISRLHLGIMGILSENKLPISEIARRLLIPKPQMTRLINQLISSGMVERQTDIMDRRVRNIILTDSGRAVLKEFKELLKTNIRKKLAPLSHHDLEELSLSLAKITAIGSKLE